MVDIVYYDLDKAKIRKDAEPVLNKIAELMAKYDFLDLAAASHTDSRASDKYNMLLSEKRAEAVKNYLSQFGIPENRVRIDWYGKEKLEDHDFYLRKHENDIEVNLFFSAYISQ